ncbi:MAG: VOC family protein [Bacteroidota bacterium]
MTKLNPYLTFNGNTREAMSFYKECLGGELSLMTVAGSPMEGQMPPQYGQSILHSVLKGDNFEIMASDLAPEAIKEGNDNHLCLGYSSEEDARKVFNALSAGGKVVNPLTRMFFGILGDFIDKYGKRWMVVCEDAK